MLFCAKKHHCKEIQQTKIKYNVQNHKMSVISFNVLHVLCPLAEACSTTEDGDEPLHCPTGYECHIIHPGNPITGIPNRGQCIKQRGNSGMPEVT